MAHPPFRMPKTWSVFALLLALGAAACGDHGNSRTPQAGETASNTGTTVEQKAGTTAVPVPQPDSAQAAAAAAKAATAAKVPGPASSARPGGTAGTTAPAKAESSSVPAPSVDSLHPFMPVTITLEAPPMPVRPRVLASVRAGRHEGFERVVFQMAGDTLPGYRIDYVEPPVVACGSGRRVPLAGGAVLVVRLQPAQAHDDAGHPTIEERTRKPGFPVLKEMNLTCDFEGQVQWALGLDRRVPFRVLKFADPARLVLDLQEGSP